ncbi:Uncharacterised protein [Campylobacter hyointestinalis subsp. hyointestinalis]|uniref:Uncharacterized protein n=1 Tax=Campylobacter hyointestinalis subsp. hyointestinalis TaxID=91352 RepID=A0A0S4SC92_CAMHY|nr:hypothetical protein [Campylobacter hyointestinalis]CUU83287.1 Uncharacterised protein [Campylobacter hyointestinalis subsp. hyointestinalis]
MLEMFFDACEMRDGGLGLNYEFCKDFAAKNGLEIVDILGILNQMLGVAIKTERPKL